MQMIKIQIPDRGERDKGIAAIMVRGRIECFRDNIFIVPEPALKVLDDMGVTYQELGRGGFDYVQKTIRDSTAAEAQ